MSDLEQSPNGGSLARSLAKEFRRRNGELYLVGGAVRDELLGKPDFDLDFATSCLPDQTAQILESLDLGTPYRVGERFGTIGVRIGDRVIEITTYRSAERYAPGSRKPDVQFGQSQLEDLRRRDFTINAMAQDPLTGEIVDPFGGRDDLRAGLIRAVGDAEDRFGEDPLRLLRCVRFASRMGFRIEPATWTALQDCASELLVISRERIRDEFTRILIGPRPVLGLTLLRDGGLLEYSVPQLLALTRMPDHGPRHPLSLWDHTMRVVELVPADVVERWGALLHDIAKPATRTHEPNGRPRFFHHEEIGAAMAREVMRSLRYSNDIVDDVSLLIETHMQAHGYSQEWTDGAVRRLMIRLGPLLPAAIRLARADAAGHALDGHSENAPRYDLLEARIDSLSREIPDQLTSPLTGDDLMQRYGRPPGPWIGRIKHALEAAVIDGRLTPDDRDAAWALAGEIVESES